MKRFTFHVTGGSPYDGEIIIIAERVITATRMAKAAVKEYNENTNYCKLTLIDEYVGRVPFNPPCVVHFESGEA